MKRGLRGDLAGIDEFVPVRQLLVDGVGSRYCGREEGEFGVASVELDEVGDGFLVFEFESQDGGVVGAVEELLEEVGGFVVDDAGEAVDETDGHGGAALGESVWEIPVSDVVHNR